MTATAPMRGRNTILVPLAPEHLGPLRAAELQADVTFRWRHSGSHPAPMDYQAIAFADVLCSFLVAVDSSNFSPVGLVSAYHADHVNGHCRVGATRLTGTEAHNIILVRGIFLFFDYLFMGWPFRKLYLEVPEFNLLQFASITTKLAVEEGRLREYVYLDGRYWDLCFLSISRETWREESTRLSRFIYGGDRPVAGYDQLE